jgi:zinc transport system permease protein
MRNMMILASGLGMAFTTIGLWLSYSLNLTSGATIIIVAGVAYLLSLGLKPWLQPSLLPHPDLKPLHPSKP